MQTESPRGDACQHAQNVKRQQPHKHSSLSCQPLFSRIVKSNRLYGDISIHNVSVPYGDQTTSSLIFQTQLLPRQERVKV